MNASNQALFLEKVSMEQLESRLELAVAKKVSVEVGYEDGCLKVTCTIEW